MVLLIKRSVCGSKSTGQCLNFALNYGHKMNYFACNWNKRRSVVHSCVSFCTRLWHVNILFQKQKPIKDSHQNIGQARALCRNLSSAKSGRWSSPSPTQSVSHTNPFIRHRLQFVDYLLIRENKVFCPRNCATHLLFMLATSSYASRMGVLLKRNIVLNYKAILGVVRSHP